MKKKGFTLVELLAVIAILAILVIVAMPNVLGMFNQAKVNSFVTEVQKIMDTATTTFTKDALLNSGKTVYYSSTENATLGTKKLDMSGNEKNYFIEMDRNGEFKRVVVYDANYCYDIYTRGGNVKRTESRSKFFVDKISKTTVNVNDVWEAGIDVVTTSGSGNSITLKGCEANILFDGTNYIDTLPEFEIGDTKYKYAPGRTWNEWINSECNTANFKYGTTVGGENIILSASDFRVVLSNYVCRENSCLFHYEAQLEHEIIKGEKYVLTTDDTDGVVVEPGDKYFDLLKTGNVLIYEQELITSDTYR